MMINKWRWRKEIRKEDRKKEKENSEDAVQSDEEFNESLKDLSIDEADVESVNTCNDFWTEELSDEGKAR